VRQSCSLRPLRIFDTPHALHSGKWVSVAVIASMGFGIAGTTAIVAVIDRILLRPLPVAEPDRVVWLRGNDSELGRVGRGANPGDAFDWRERARTFSAVGW
jgi:hypothetical protein